MSSIKKATNFCKISHFSLNLLHINLLSEHAAEVPHEGPQLGVGSHGDPGLGVIPQSNVLIKIETEPAKVAASLVQNLARG